MFTSILFRMRKSHAKITDPNWALSRHQRPRNLSKTWWELSLLHPICILVSFQFRAVRRNMPHRKSLGRYSLLGSRFTRGCECRNEHRLNMHDFCRDEKVLSGCVCFAALLCPLDTPPLPCYIRNQVLTLVIMELHVILGDPNANQSQWCSSIKYHGKHF